MYKVGSPLPKHHSIKHNTTCLRRTGVVPVINCVCLVFITVHVLLARLHDARSHSDHTLVETSVVPISTAIIGEPEIWALGPRHKDEQQQQQLLSLLDHESLNQLKALCGRCLYRTLTSYLQVHDFGRATVVSTGDIPAMWVRDSAVQMASYLPRIHKRPAIRQVVEGAIRTQAYFILQDPWANAYNLKYVAPSSLPKYDRQLGRGGWVWTRNFELDSVAYFMNFLWNYHQTPGIWSADRLLKEPVVHDAVVVLLKLLLVEQHHEEQSPYR